MQQSLKQMAPGGVLVVAAVAAVDQLRRVTYWADHPHRLPNAIEQPGLIPLVQLAQGCQPVGPWHMHSGLLGPESVTRGGLGGAEDG